MNLNPKTGEPTTNVNRAKLSNWIREFPLKHWKLEGELPKSKEWTNAAIEKEKGANKEVKVVKPPSNITRNTTGGMKLFERKSRKSRKSRKTRKGRKSRKSRK